MNAIDQLYIPPHSIEAEQSVIGAILIDADNSLDRIEGIITEGDFYRRDHNFIFAAVRSLANSGKPVDVITVAEALEAVGNLNLGKCRVLCKNRSRTCLAASLAGSCH